MEDLFKDAFVEQEPEEVYKREPDSYNDRLFKKRDNLNKGNFNVIPYPYKRASYYFPGLEKPTYTVITAESKFGKTSYASAAFMLEPLWQAYTNPKLKLWYHYCNLEESEDRIKDRIVSWLLYKYTNGAIRIGYRDLNSATVPLSKEVSDVLESDDFKDIRDFFFSRIEFDDNSYPTGLEIGVKQFANKHGQVLRGESFTSENNMTGKKSTYRTITGYKQNDEDEFLIIFADNLNNISPESGQTLLQAITRVSKFFKDIRNKFNFVIIALQQLSADSDSNDAFKLQRYEPRITQLGDCKQVRRDVNSGIAVFSPTMKFEGLDPGDPKRHNYKGYNLDKFGDYFRTIIFMIDRDKYLIYIK